MKVYLRSLGCKLNQSEVEALARRFIAAGCQVVTDAEEADLCVVNTCAVTHIAARKSRRLIRRLHRANPEARIVVTGCYAELFPHEVAKIEGVELVVGNADKERLVERLGIRGYGLGVTTPIPYPFFFNRTRAFVKIQDGCNNRCAYCVIGLARGRERSRPPEEVLAEIGARVEAGCKEVVLTGVNIGAYGRDLGTSLGRLIEDILTKTAVPRLRLSSIEPWDFDPSLLRLWEDPRLCRHLHLPLQSGCDATLRRMRRRYTAAEYAELVERAREAIPDLALTTDVIVGFPGETEADFEESLRFVEKMGFARLHVFKYSARPGTPAATMPQQVPCEEKRRRSEAMMALARRGSEKFRRRFLGRTMEVLWERKERRREGRRRIWSGLTDNYIRVWAESEADLANTITPAKLVALTEDGMRGEIV
ncbi:MAG TPA: tRNA (N(6)-L-threonylcarbamoyladenosine(37)-C(2))-methylthiotransferase MtaB [Anaerolineae bacterium]|nr:tRNA (N(6)-L-threonylcarbamoyladenosine(37)-C(2))-methylthiotransferase MtaB [Anaerolineae bacterium]